MSTLLNQPSLTYVIRDKANPSVIRGKFPSLGVAQHQAAIQGLMEGTYEIIPESEGKQVLFG